MNNKQHHQKQRVVSIPGVAHALWWLVVACFLPSLISAAEPGVCAQAKIEIKQELTLERQAFDAVMKITNGLETAFLENVEINVNFKDEAGNAVKASSDSKDLTASFFIHIDKLSGISDVSGAGSVAPVSSAEIHWLIIPAPGAGGTNPNGKLYLAETKTVGS